MFAAFDHDRFSKPEKIGEVRVELKDFNLAQPVEEWRDFVYPDEGSEKVSSCIFYMILSIIYDIFYMKIYNKHVTRLYNCVAPCITYLSC